MYKIRIISCGFCLRSPCPSGIWKSPRARHRALEPPLRRPFVASRLTPASAPALGDFQIPTGLRGSGAISTWKNPNFIYKFCRGGETSYISLSCRVANIGIFSLKAFTVFSRCATQTYMFILGVAVALRNQPRRGSLELGIFKEDSKIEKNVKGKYRESDRVFF